VIVDLGTGDGRAALTLAETDPRTLVIGMDADAASMAEMSRRAARPAAKSGRPNLLFVVAAAESPPRELLGLADEVRILFPWGSLLRGVLGADRRVAQGIARLARPGGRMSAIVSVTPKDGPDASVSFDPTGLAGITDAAQRVGLRLTATRRADVEDVRATRSTWGRRLLAGAADRPVWRLEFVNAALPTETDGRRVREACGMIPGKTLPSDASIGPETP
jgi:16S rRNA (adenine(1408)-N(1))-methyltransferase